MQKRPRTMIMPPPNGNRIYERPSSSSQFSRTPSTYQPSIDPELLVQRLNYLESMMTSMKSFQRSKNANILKDFIKGVQYMMTQNNSKLTQMIDRTHELKDQMTNSSKAKPEELRQLQELRVVNVRLQQQYQKEKQREETLRKKREAIMDREAADKQIANMRQTLRQLKSEVELLKGQNQELSGKLSKKNFFKEYEFVVRECEGIQKQNQKLQGHIKRWKAELAKLRE